MKLRLKNFRCYEDKVFEIDNGMVLLSGVSGCGKTSVILGIYFALYGYGNKVIMNGKTSCCVEFEFDDIKIKRTKKPNHLLVNNMYEDDVGQNVINDKFGENYDIIGYISQNCMNSFITMSPIDKLSFLERFAFKNTDINGIKIKCKAEIKNRYETMIKTISQKEMIISMFQTMEEPKEIKYPIKCLLKNQNMIEKNENVKYKNCETLIKRSNKIISKLTEELNSVNIYNTSYIHMREVYESMVSKYEDLIKEKSSILYIGDDKLKIYIDKLEHMMLRKELKMCEIQYEKDIEKFNMIEKQEKEDNNDEIIKIESIAWKEHTKEEVDMCIKEYKECISVLEKYEKLTEELKLYVNSKTEDEMNDIKSKIDVYKSNLQNNLEKIDKCKKQKEVLVCPSCFSNLNYKENKLILSTENVPEDIYNIEEKCKEEIKVLNENITKNEKLYSQCMMKHEQKKNIEKKIKDIKDTFDEVPNLKDVKDDYEYMLDYKNININYDRKKEELYNKSKMKSRTLSVLSNDIKKQKEMISELKSKILIDEVGEDEKSIREIIKTEQFKRDRILYIDNNIQNIEVEMRLYEERIENLKIEHQKKYTEVRDISDIKSKIDNENELITEYKVKKNSHEYNIQQIQLYNKYKEEMEKYESWKKKIQDIEIEEKISRDKHSFANMFREKIIEAESIALSNIISSINLHAQIYLDSFFVENPIVVKLLPFKESKKNTKPQINITVEYKGMECDINTLSGGELARVVIAFTLALGEIFNIQLLLLDESTANLDQEMTNTVLNTIKENFKGKMILVIAHQVVTGTFDSIITI